MDMADPQDEQAPESRTAHFNVGASGSGMGSTIASSLPQVAQAAPAFHSDNNVNAIPNEIPTPNGKSPSTFTNSLFPYMAKSSPLTRIQQEAGKQQ